MTEIHANESDERVGLCGYEEDYEITRKGEVYSNRLNRFIKHKYFYYGDTSSTYIEFQFKGQKVKFNIGEAVAKSYLAQNEMEEIASELPREIEDLKEVWRLNIIDPLTNKYNVCSNAIFYVFRKEYSHRRLIENKK
jgi:hypothetical protein